jgi:hypothetical protein
VGQVCKFLRWQRNVPVPSSAAFGKVGDGFVRDIERFAKDNDVPVVGTSTMHWTTSSPRT